MPGDTNRRYKSVTLAAAGTIALAAASSTEIVLADYVGSDAGVYAGGVIEFPASNAIGNCVWYAKAAPDSALLPLYDEAGEAVSVAVSADGGVYPLPYAAAFGAYSIAPQASSTASTFTAGLMT